MIELKAINYTITLLAVYSRPSPQKNFEGRGGCTQAIALRAIIHYCCHVGGFGKKYLIVLTINMATLSLVTWWKTKN